MNIEQERADFEAWLTSHCDYDDLNKLEIELARDAWQAGRAALQSQDHPNRKGRVMDKLFCDLKTDEEKAAFFLSGRGYETGVISQAIQNDVAMAYHRCVEYKKELEALQSQDRDEGYRAMAAEYQRWIDAYHQGMDYEDFLEKEARRIERRGK